MCQKLYKIQFYQWVRRNRGKRGKSVGKRVQHTPPTGTTLTEFRRFLNTDFGTLRMNAKSTHTFAPLTIKITEETQYEENNARGRFLGPQPSRHLRPRHQQRDVPQSLGWRLASLANGLGVAGRSVFQPACSCFLAPQPSRHLRPRHQQRDVPQSLGW